MKTQNYYLLFVLLCFTLTVQGTSYYSQGSLDPSNKNNWHSSRTGGIGSGKPRNFDSAGDTFVVQSGHSMSTSLPWLITITDGGITIERGGALTLGSFTVISTFTVTVDSGSTFTINDGVSGSDLIVEGTLKVAGTFIYGTLATGEVNSGAIYQHKMNGGDIPTFTWNSGSTCEITGVTNTRPNNIAQTYHHFTWNCASQSADVVLAGGFTAGLTGDFTVTNTNAYALVRANGSSNTLSIGGNINIAAGTTFNLTSGAGNPIISVTGAVTVNGRLTKTGSGTASLTSAASIIGNSGSTIDIGTSTLGGTCTFTLSSGANLFVGHASGITSSGATGNIQVTGTRTYSSAANYTYNGSNVQVFGNGLPATVNNLTINNSNTGMALNRSITIDGMLTLTSGNLAIGAYTLTLNGGFSGSSTHSLQGSGRSTSISVGGSGSIGTLYFDQTYSGTTNRIGDITINRVGQTITLGNTLEVAGAVTLTAGTLASAGYLTLISDATGTARIGQIGTTSDVTGNVTMQTYIPASTRRYRMLSSPLQNFSWTQLTDDIFVTGQGGSTNGFDQSNNNSASCFTYQESTSGGRGWKAVTATSGSVASGSGLYVFIRGDRTLAAPAWYAGPYPAQNAVTIDYVSQPINKGTYSPSVSYTNTGVPGADGWNLIGNPYPSPIDWTMLTRANLSSFFYTYNPASGSYVANNGSNYIAAGQSFFVQAIGSAPSITFTESAKTSGAPTKYFKTASQPIMLKMVKDSANADVAWMSFDPSASKQYNVAEDALKFANPLINLGFYIDSARTLQYTTVPMTQVADTFLITASAPAGTYTLEFSYANSTLPVSKNMYLRDLFTNTVVKLRSTASYTFSITSNPASAGNRFELILVDPSQLPVEWLSFSARKSGTDVVLNWQTAHEKNNNHFVVERSTDNSSFTGIASITAAGNVTSASSYSYTNKDAFAGMNTAFYYRIRQIDQDGKYSYSAVAYVNERPAGDLEVSVFPNPAASAITVTTSALPSSIVITDIAGREVYRARTAGLSAGETTLPVHHLEDGAYFICVSSAQQANTLKFIKSAR